MQIIKKIFNKIFSKKKYNVLVFGTNQIAYAITKKIKESPFLASLYVANASEAMQKIAINIPYNNEKLVEEAIKLKIDIFICNDTANIQGIIEAFKENNIFCFGVNQKWTMLEASKQIGKRFVEKYNINHPRYNVLYENDDFNKYINNYNYPIVIKSNGYARGTGVFICNTREECVSKISEIRELKITTSSKKILIEEFIEGKEISYMQFWDGKNLIPFKPIKDFKKRNNYDKGPNTGGMASYCPYINLTKKEKRQLKNYDKKMKRILKNEKADFVGIVYSGVIFRNEELYILEYNMRFGCPEGIALLSNLESDFIEMLLFARKKQLNRFKLKYKDGTSFALSLTCLNYPHKEHDCCEISQNVIKHLESKNINVIYSNGIFKNGYYIKDSNYVFVLEKNSKDPFNEIYRELNNLNIKNAHFRTDINNYLD